MSTPVLATLDFTKPFVIECNASGFGIGIVFMQKVKKFEVPMGCPTGLSCDLWLGTKHKVLSNCFPCCFRTVFLLSKTANKYELYPLKICPLGSDLMSL
jgi:hypothetical protein